MAAYLLTYDLADADPSEYFLLEDYIKVNIDRHLVKATESTYIVQSSMSVDELQLDLKKYFNSPGDKLLIAELSKSHAHYGTGFTSIEISKIDLKFEYAKP